MVTIRWLAWAVVLALTSLNQDLAFAESGSISLSKPMLYDRHPAFAGEEGGMWCTHPSKPNILIGVTNANEGGEIVTSPRVHNGVKFSDDGGVTWRRTLLTNSAPIEIDPACAYGVDGSAFVVAMDGLQGLLLWYSPDGGRVWEQPKRVNHARMLDRPYIVVDHSRSKWRGRLYIVAISMNMPPSNVPDEIAIFTSDDLGRTFHPPIFIKLPNTGMNKGVTHLGQPVVLSDGTVVIAWTEAYFGHGWGGNRWACAPEDAAERDAFPCGTSAIKIVRSQDGAQTFEMPRTVARGEYDISTDYERLIIGKWYPALAADNTDSPLHNSLYLAWSDTKNGRQQVLFTRSDDGGTKWAYPNVISDDYPFDAEHPIEGPHNAMVNLAVNRNGVVGVLFYAQISPAPEAQFWPMFSVSHDGGISWSEEERVTKAPILLNGFNPAWTIGEGVFNEKTSPKEKTNITFLSSYGGMPTCLYGLTSDVTGTFHLFGFSNPLGFPQFDAVTARVRGSAAPKQTTAGELTIRLGTFTYNKRKRVASVEMTVKNSSSDIVKLPIRVIIERSPSESDDMRAVEFLRADNDRKYFGAWWEFGEPGAVLPPGAVTASRTISMRISGQLGGFSRTLNTMPSIELTITPVHIPARQN